MAMRFVKPGAGWLKTEALPNGGVRVTGAYKRLGYKDGVFVVSFLAFAVAALKVPHIEGDNSSWFIVALITAAAGWVASRSFKKKIAVTVLPDAILIKWRKFSRNIPLEFRCEQHHQAALSRFRKYREAIEVVMQYGERRVVLAEMHLRDVENAKQLVMRLQAACDREEVTDAMLDRMLLSKARKGEFGPIQDIR